MFIQDSVYRSILKNIPVLCVDLLIINEGKFLLLKRNNEPAKGEYWFPGGRIFKLESIEDAALRKAKEEVNLKCNFKYIVSVEETIFKKTGNMFTDIHTVNIVCKLTTERIDDIRLDSFHENYIWTSFDKITDLKLHLAVSNPIKLEFSKLNVMTP
jgi:colanic acid biosynthesis protein WcaH